MRTIILKTLNKCQHWTSARTGMSANEIRLKILHSFHKYAERTADFPEIYCVVSCDICIIIQWIETHEKTHKNHKYIGSGTAGSQSMTMKWFWFYWVKWPFKNLLNRDKPIEQVMVAGHQHWAYWQTAKSAAIVVGFFRKCPICSFCLIKRVYYLWFCHFTVGPIDLSAISNTVVLHCIL